MTKKYLEKKKKKKCVFSPNQAKIRIKKKNVKKMTKCYDEKMPWIKKKKKIFSPIQAKIRLKKKFWKNGEVFFLSFGC